MADIFVIVGTFETQGAPAGKARMYGRSSMDGYPSDIGWETVVNFSDNTTQINAAAINAAVAEWGRLNQTVSGSDKKILFCGAV